MSEGKLYIFLVDEEEAGERLDAYLSEHIPGLSRSRLQKAIKSGECRVAGTERVKPSYRLKCAERIELAFAPPRPLDVVAEEIPLDVVFEDESIVVVNKPAGMVTHPAPGHTSGTLVNALLAHCKNLSGIGGVLRPGIVHRLDAGTSGLLVVAKSDEAHIALSRQLMERTMKRRYVAIILGKMPLDEGTIDIPIGRSKKDRKKMAVSLDGGKEAVTHYRVIDTYEPFQFIALKLETGRTHQIRVHLSHIGRPVLGDYVYGGRRIRRGKTSRESESRAREALKLIDRQALHAEALVLRHPLSGELMEFVAPPPADFKAVLEFISS